MHGPAAPEDKPDEEPRWRTRNPGLVARLARVDVAGQVPGAGIVAHPARVRAPQRRHQLEVFPGQEVRRARLNRQCSADISTSV